MKQQLGLEDSQNNHSLGSVMPMFLTLIFSAAGHAYFVITFPAVARKFGFGDFQASLVMGYLLYCSLYPSRFGGLSVKVRVDVLSS